MADACSGGTSSPSGPGGQPGAMFWGGPTQSSPSVGDQETYKKRAAALFLLARAGRPAVPCWAKGHVMM